MFEPAEGLFGTFITEEWIIDEFARCQGVQISHLKFQRIGETEGSFSRVCLMECESNGRVPKKFVVKYHNTETLFYQHARGVTGVPRIFLSRPLSASDCQGIICMEYLENARTRPVYEYISIDEMKSILTLYANIQKGCANVPDGVRSRLNTNVFELLSPTTLSLEMVHYGNPVEDLIRLFTTGLTASERKVHTIELLEYYRTQVTSLIAGLEQTFTSDWLLSCYNRIFPMAGLWAIVSLHASFESSTSREPPDSSKLDRITKKIHGIAAEIVETVCCSDNHQ
ncbi:unnamed protein product [Haemonchus placei]|uniref:CHK domain-containing protein n=1 Tax=Haemonchus placei TaxID=6290 RepID=A0A0N4WNR6_HAEPC|nr:unnamed protein product [Haemonchus placei]